MPPIVKWQCKSCGKIRMMNPDVTLVLCNECEYKQMIRIGETKKLSPLDKEVNAKLFDD